MHNTNSTIQGVTPPRNLYWISNTVAGSARLRSLAEVRWLSLNGFKLVVTLTEEPLPRELIDYMKNRGIHWLWEPTPDFSPPTVEQVNKILKSIREAERSGGKVLVHCGAGLGRTGTVLACYLISRGLCAEHAIDRVRDARPGAIEAINQIAFVYYFERLIKGQRRY